MDMIEKNPDKPWDWEYISCNPNLTMEMIEKNPDKPWDWNDISLNPTITMEMLEKNPDKPWVWFWISLNPTITMEFIEKNPENEWSWDWISQNTFQKYILSLMATRIQKMYRLFKLRHLLKKLILKSRLNTEIECLPGVGVEYFKSMASFQSN
jgi:hypothetical protein